MAGVAPVAAAEAGTDCVIVDDGPAIIESVTIPGLVNELQPLCDFGYVCDFTLQDGTEVSAILVGVSSSSLILDRWDELRHRPAGDLFVMELTAVRRVVVP